jgi:hypothetical protein
MGEDFFSGQLRTRGGPAAWIADHRGKIADDEDGFVPELLKLS